MTELNVLAKAHMRRQVRDTAQVQAALSALWGRTIDPSDIDGSFLKFQAEASTLIKYGRNRGEKTAQTFFTDSKLLAGFKKPAARVPFQPTETLANRAALHATSVAHAKRQIGRGVPVEVALASAQGMMLRAAKRRILEAPRRRLIALSQADGDARGWARVSDGTPCSFCAMLVGRGPVYGQGGGFEAHDGCGCSVEPVFDRKRGRESWSPEARAFRDLYDEEPDPDAPFRGSNAETFRARLAAARADGFDL